jgi:hypothetical protein
MTQPDVFQNDYLEVVELAHRALSSTDAPYCVIGALALGIYGTPRATYDVDFLILAQSNEPQPFLDLLCTVGFVINESWHDANPMAREAVLRLAHPTPPIFL